MLTFNLCFNENSSSSDTHSAIIHKSPMSVYFATIDAYANKPRIDSRTEI